MAQANPAQSITSAIAAGAGTAADLTGAATGVTVPTTISMVVSISGWTAAWDKVSAPPYAVIGLEVSLDSSSWVRIGSVQCSGNGVFSTVKAFPSRYARGVLDTLDGRISAITVNAWVAGGQ
jgi:hypothetical protein